MSRPRVFVTRRIPEVGLERIRAACEVEGRNPDTLALTITVLVDVANGEAAIPETMSMGVSNPVTGTPEQIAAALREYANVGVSHIQIYPFPLTPVGIERLIPVLEILDA